MKILAKTLAAILLFSLPALAQNAVHNEDVLAALQQSGVFLQLQNSGTTLAIRTAGLVTMNCTGNLACSYDSPSGTFTMNNDPNVTVTNVPSVSITGSVTIGNSPFRPIPVTQSGTWTVQPGNTQNTTPWLVSLSGANSNVGVTQITSPWVTSVSNFPVTQPVTEATLDAALANPLPVVVKNPQSQVTINNTALQQVPVKVMSGMIVLALINGVPTPVQLVEGQSIMAQSLPVAIASDQSTISASDFGKGPDGNAHNLATDGAGNLYVQPLGLPKQPCNPVRTQNCQHF